MRLLQTGRGENNGKAVRQLKEMMFRQDVLEEVLGIKNSDDQEKFIAQVRVTTFDASIGQEADATIMLFVKSCISDFISEQHRLNVAISRHKYDWVIMGDVQAL